MLDTFEIVTTSGVVVWSRKWASVKPSVINNFITDVFVEEKNGSGALAANKSAASNAPYKTEQHTLRWTFVKELGIIFVVRFGLGPPLHCPFYGRLQCANFPRGKCRLYIDRCSSSPILTSLSTTSRPFLSSCTATN